MRTTTTFPIGLFCESLTRPVTVAVARDRVGAAIGKSVSVVSEGGVPPGERAAVGDVVDASGCEGIVPGSAGVARGVSVCGSGDEGTSGDGVAAGATSVVADS